MPLLSIIIPTYNRSELLTEAIASVRLQEFTDYEVIVVDDGSTDDTATRFACGNVAEPFRMVRQSHAGQGAARNRGISEARGEYCVFLDSDDQLFPWSLRTIAQAILDRKKPLLLLMPAIRFSDVKQLPTGPDALRVTDWRDIYTYGVTNHLGVTGTLVARTELVRQVGGFIQESMVGDGADLMLRLGAIPNIITIDSPPTYAYRVRPENTENQERWARRGHELIDRYRQGVYPAGRDRALRTLLARDAAYFSLLCLRLGGRRNCLNLYRSSFGLQLRTGNIGYLLATPIRVILSII